MTGRRPAASTRRAAAFDGITLADVKAGPVRLNLPPDYAPFAAGRVRRRRRASASCTAEREARAGRDPLPHYTPPHEDPQTRPDLAARYPLQLLSPPHPSFLNSTFVNVDSLRRSAGEPTLEIHPLDAAARGIADGQTGGASSTTGAGSGRRPWWARRSSRAWWSRSACGGDKFTADGVNCNTTTSTALTDLGGGATFFDNLVEVAVDEPRPAPSAAPYLACGVSSDPPAGGA